MIRTKVAKYFSYRYSCLLLHIVSNKINCNITYIIVILTINQLHFYVLNILLCDLKNSHMTDSRMIQECLILSKNNCSNSKQIQGLKIIINGKEFGTTRKDTFFKVKLFNPVPIVLSLFYVWPVGCLLARPVHLREVLLKPFFSSLKVIE